jgi:hypothetical protein
MDSAAALEILRQGSPLADIVVSGPLTLRDLGERDAVASPVVIRNAVLDQLDAGFILFQAPVILEGVTVVGDCIFHGCFFPTGFSAIRCQFRKGIDLRWGGHNKNGSIFRLEDCEFEGFADFEDDCFESPVEIRRCAFRCGSNLFGLKGHPLQVTFDADPIIEGNTGRLDLDEAPEAG